MSGNIYVNTTSQSDGLIRDMIEMRYYLYYRKVKYSIIVIAAIIIIISAYFFSTVTSSWPTIPMFFGCWLLVSSNVPAKAKANQLIRQMNGNYHTTKYVFTDSNIEATEGNKSNVWEYWRFQKMGETSRCAVLFINSDSAIILEKKGFSLGDSESFREFLEYKTKKKMYSISQFQKFHINFKDIFTVRKRDNYYRLR